MKNILKLIACVVLAMGVWGFLKPLPDGIHVQSTPVMVAPEQVHFYRDVTYVDTRGVRQSDQEIFDALFSLLDRADSYILLDMFLYNDMLGTAPSAHRTLASELTHRLVAAKEAHPDMVIQVVTDPINEVYGGITSPYFQELEAYHIPVITTTLLPLRDSNPLYSAWWRTFIRWFGNSTHGGWLQNPFAPEREKLTLRSYLALLNFKANHRKVLAVDLSTPEGAKHTAVFITSANPHDGSSAHTNTAIEINDALFAEVVASERAVAKFSDTHFISPKEVPTFDAATGDDLFAVSLITEGAIKRTVLEKIDALDTGDSLDMAMFYLADRDVVAALKRADGRGAELRILLDPNKDAFGRQKDGVPNRPVAAELLRDSLGDTEVRWCDTHGEQCHSKLLLFDYGDRVALIQGSANLTSRNIGDYNLETNVLIEGQKMGALEDAYDYFEMVWHNESDKIFSTEYATYKDERRLKYLQYRLMEALGISTF